MLKVTLTSTEKAIFKGMSCQSVTLQSATGKMQLLPGHCKYIGVIVAKSDLEIVDEQGLSHPMKLDDTDGFFKVDRDELDILVSRIKDEN
jgi:F0F1-type ATP synthase epsilon subunit